MKCTAAAALACLLAVACTSGEPDRPTLATTATTTAPSTPTTAQPVPATTTPSSQALLDAVCSGRARFVTTGPAPKALTEISGLAASRRFLDVVWAHEDSGGPSTVTALGLDGSVRATVKLTNAFNLDWEDIALAPGPGGRDYLYVADIGDNFKLRGQVTIYAFPEPDITNATSPIEVRADAIVSRYPTGATDAEAFGVDGFGTMWIIAKSAGAPPAIYRQAVGEKEFTRLPEPAPVDPQEGVSALDISADGRLLAIRTINTLTLVELSAGVASAHSGRRCSAPIPKEGQGESVAFLFDGSGLVTVSEYINDEPVELHVLRIM